MGMVVRGIRCLGASKCNVFPSKKNVASLQKRVKSVQPAFNDATEGGNGGGDLDTVEDGAGGGYGVEDVT